MLWKYSIRHYNPSKKYLLEIFIYIYYKYYINIMVYKMFSLYFNISNKALYKICIKYSVLFGLRLESDYALKIEIEIWPRKTKKF